MVETSTMENNGKAEKIGELRGEIRALVRQFELMSADFNALKHSLDQTRSDIGEHVAFQLGREKEAERRQVNGRWWTGTMMAGCGVLAGVIVKFWV